MNRRNFIGAILAAPAIVRAEILMPAPAIVRAEILMPVTKIWMPKFQITRFNRYSKLAMSTIPLCEGVVPSAEYSEQTHLIEYDISPENAIRNFPITESYATRVNRLWMERINRI